MTAIDFAAIADELLLIGKERSDNIDAMARNPRDFTAEEVAKRRRRLPTLRQAVIVARALADCPDAQEIIVARVRG